MSGRSSVFGLPAAIVTVAFSQASRAMRWARSSSSQARSTIKPASVCDSRVTRFCRVAAGRSSRVKSASRIAATSPNRSTMRSIDKGAISAPLFRQLLLILHDFLAFTATYPLAYPRSFPPPWSVEELDACYVVRDQGGTQRIKNMSAN